MSETACLSPALKHPSRRILCAAILAAALGAAFGFLLSRLIFDGIRPDYASISPYRGCDLVPEYIFRACSLCRPLLLEAVIVCLFACCAFARPLLSGFFFFRGMTTGMAISCCLLSNTPLPAYLFLVGYLLITLIWLFLTRALYTAHGISHISETLTSVWIAVGAACAVRILASCIPIP